MDERIKEVLAAGVFADQSELLDALAARGVVLTQSTLSRKLRSLGYQKQGGRYLQSAEAAIKLLSVLTVEPNLLVLRTSPGFANALAVQLDLHGLPGQAGTIAGDDTVFVAVTPNQLALAEAAAKRFL